MKQYDLDTRTQTGVVPRKLDLKNNVRRRRRDSGLQKKLQRDRGNVGLGGERRIEKMSEFWFAERQRQHGSGCRKNRKKKVIKT